MDERRRGLPASVLPRELLRWRNRLQSAAEAPKNTPMPQPNPVCLPSCRARRVAPSASLVPAFARRRGAGHPRRRIRVADRQRGDFRHQLRQRRAARRRGNQQGRRRARAQDQAHRRGRPVQARPAFLRGQQAHRQRQSGGRHRRDRQLAFAGGRADLPEAPRSRWSRPVRPTRP